jgi:Flp pilus assembly protein TadG
MSTELKIRKNCCCVRKGERGASLVLFTILTALVILPMIGLAVDGSILFFTKAKLSAAVDAAALAAGRAINTKQTQAQNSGPVVNIANQYFSANFPNGWMGATVLNGGPTVTYQTLNNATQQVSVQASASVPLYFMRFLGQNVAVGTASATSVRRNVLIMFVLDRSGSMSMSGACPIMQQDAIQFVNRFTENFDTMGLVTYSTTANANPIDFGPSQVFKAGMANVINSLNCTGATSMTQALHVAYQSILDNGIPGGSGANIIVLFTDGQPNEIVYDNWPVNNIPGKKNTVWDADNNQSDTTQPPTWSGLTNCAANSNNPLKGGFTIFLPVPKVYGYTGGLYDAYHQVPVNTAPGLNSTSAAQGCYFTDWGAQYARYDIAYIPSQDKWRNLTSAGYGSNPPYYGYSGSNPVQLATFSSSAAYPNQIRPDQQVTGVIAAAINSVDYQAQYIRNDTTYKPVIYTIGLGGAPDMPIDQTLMERIANDPRSPIFDRTKTAGYFAYASNPSQLAQAMDEVASQILRLSH